ncbi:MAG: carboxypeptidase-like regulatory domain-containing protein [Bryobacteraceae bacterium]
MPKFVLGAIFILLTIWISRPRVCRAQGETTSAIAGQVRDASGGGIPQAKVIISNNETGLKRTVQTDNAGRFQFPQLTPGTYTLQVTAPGFDDQQNNSVAAPLGRTQTVDFVLQLRKMKQEVTVGEQPPLINTENANTATTLNAHALENLPNPGGDLTYPLQFAAGALLNTAGSGNDFVGGSNGYGNVEFNGLPALSNGYIVDGLETNDPLTNLNSGLSTNLVLGLNSIAEVTVNTLSYAVDQGRYGASQVNYITKAGTNEFHGNLYELWNGSLLNAADFFTNATPGNHKPRSTVNHFGGSLGGPILHNKLFFFFDSEWVRIALPIVTEITVPTPALESYILSHLPLGGRDVLTGAVYGAQPQLVPFYKNLFSLYGNTAGTSLAMLGCPFNSNGTAAGGNPPNGDGCANRQSISHSSDDHEQVQTARIDYNINDRNMTWYRFQADTGLQAAWTDPINPLFNALSPQPLYSFASGYTHVFSSTLVNYFNPAFSWYQSLFGPTNFAQTLSAFPIVLEPSGSSASFTSLGGLDNTWVQGRRASRFFINDNLAWTVGAHELRFGTNTRILRLNDYDFGEGTVPTVSYTDLPQFIYGIASTASATYPLADSQPFSFLNADFYAQDKWQITPALTWTFGLRSTHNSNPLNPHDLVARLPGSFASISHDVNQPLDSVIQTNLGNLFQSTPLAILLQTQVNYTWSHCLDTVSNGGFLQFAAGGILSPLPYNLARDEGPCDYDIRDNLTANYVYQLPVRVKNHLLGYVLNGWQISGSVFWHSGIPFSVLSAAYTASGDGIVNGSGPEFASVVPGIPLYEHNPIPGVTQAGTIQWLNPNAFVSAVNPSTGACVGGDGLENCQFGNLGRNALRGPDFVWSDFYLTKWFTLSERVKLRIDGQFFNVFNHPNFALPSIVIAGIPGNPATQTGFGALTSTTSPPTGILGVGLGGDSSPRMIAFQARLEF